MNVGAQTISAIVHAAVLIGVVVWVKVEPRLPTSITAFVSGEEEKPKPPEPPPEPPKPPPRARPLPAPRATAAAPQVAAPSGPSSPLLDVGMLEADDGTGVPEGAVQLPMGGPAAAVRAEPPPPPRPAECAETSVPPEPVNRVDIAYPPNMAGVDGRVVAKVTVSAAGEVTAVEIVTGVDPAVDEAVRDSLLKWRFRAATRCGRAVTGTWTLGLKFEASD